MNRYHRQTLVPHIGEAGQARLAASRVLLVGCGALGGTIADQLIRAGVGTLIVADRDWVEWTNLQRQVLFDEADARAGTPKAVAAARRLGAVNSSVVVRSEVVDVHAGNVETLAGCNAVGRKSLGGKIDLMLDGTDNVATRYLLNDVAVKHGVPWVYGGCVGTEGRVMAIRPGGAMPTPCLRCIFPDPPPAAELATCDTAGVLGPAAAVVGAMQALAGLQILSGNEPAAPRGLLTIDFWRGRFRSVGDESSRRADCPCCAERRLAFLEASSSESATSLCGRNAVQIRPDGRVVAIDLAAAAERFGSVGEVTRNNYFVRCQLHEPAGVGLTLFADGRLIVQGTNDTAKAKGLYARYVGS